MHRRETLLKTTNAEKSMLSSLLDCVIFPIRLWSGVSTQDETTQSEVSEMPLEIASVHTIKHHRI